jgi:C4-dicarboxylate transporter DctM subunit
MSDIAIGAACMIGSLLLIQTGMHIGVALMLLSFVGVWTIKGGVVAGKLLASSAATSISSEVFGVIPLFVIMGLLVSATGMGRDTFDVAARILHRIRGGLGISTVAANTVFAACTGTSIASASVFTKVAVPEMVRHGHTPGFSVGVVAGSSVLGMLIPPSLLMIIFGVIANTSIGDLFKSGVVPGILLAVAFCITILLLGHFRGRFVFSDPGAQASYRGPLEDAPWWLVLLKFLPICILIAVVLGGIYGGAFTPTEAGAAGALAAFVIALVRPTVLAGPVSLVLIRLLPLCILIALVLGRILWVVANRIEEGLIASVPPLASAAAGAVVAVLLVAYRRPLLARFGGNGHGALTLRTFWEVTLETGRVTAAICFLLMAAMLYAQMLTLSGLPYAVGQWLQTAELSFPLVLVGYLIVVVLMGCFLDSLSIMLILLPFVLPVIDGFGVNLIWFGLITIIAIEIGLLTPPLGVAIFVVKANLDDQRITPWQIFKGTFPMTLTMVVVLALCVFFPWLSLVLVGGSQWTWW